MKKLLGLLLILLVTACEGPRGPMGPPDEDGTSSSYVSPVYKIKADEWQPVTMPDGTSQGYICEIKDKNLVSDDYEYAAVNGYMFLEKGTANEVKTPLPHVDIFSDGEGYTYMEHYTFEYMPGYITFYIKSDSPRPLDPPVVCYFQIIATY